MYYFPFLLLTPDNARNEAIADRLEEEASRTKAHRPASPGSEATGSDAIPALYALQDHADAMLVRVARSNLETFADEISPLDQVRVRDKLKRLLLLLRRMVPDMHHEWHVPGWLDAGACPILVDLNVADYSVSKANSEFLTRLSALHHQVFLLSQHGVLHVLTQDATGPDHVPDDLSKKLMWMEKAAAAVHEYTRILNML